jgi:hypothetical protein
MLRDIQHHEVTLAELGKTLHELLLSLIAAGVSRLARESR